MEKVILHIGMHKTGTTSIQSAIKNFEGNRVKVASFEETNHSIPMLTIFSKHRLDYHHWQKKGFTKFEINELKRKYIEILDKDLCDKDYDKLIISGEGIIGLDASDLQIMIDFFKGYNLNINIICYVRDPLDWLVSNTQERIKGLMPVLKNKTGFKPLIQKFLDLVSKDNIKVFKFEEVIKSHKSVVQHFSEILSIKLFEYPKINKSLTPFQLALTARLNEVPIKIIGNKKRYMIRQKIFNHIKNIDSNNQHKLKLDKQYFMNLLSENIEEDCEWLNKNFGIKYEINRGDCSKNIEDYFEEILSNSTSQIKNIFKFFDVPYDPKISLTYNFLEIYFSLAYEQKEINFCAETYLSLNPDIKVSGVNPYQHYLMSGIKEGRKIQ